MALPPAWKVRREIWRIRNRIAQKLGGVFYDSFRQYLYDRRALNFLKVREGDQPLSDRVAVFVLFQPSGLAPSTFFTLDHLLKNGWSPLVISNAPLTESDAADVSRRAAKVMERPNVGYDFGAYRESIRYLDRIGHRLERLILMNDSTWFPLREDDDSLARMEASGADLVGHIYKIEDIKDRGRDHVESHLLMFSRRALEDEAFQRFWNCFVMSNRRDVTIESGEKRITQVGIAAGWAPKGLLSRETLISRFGSLMGVSETLCI
jgi:lipopolysaccharide biosynthesis protein